MNVDTDETLPAQLHALLRARCSRSVRVINSGLPGSTLTEQASLIERGLTLAPDLIVLQFVENDVVDLGGTPLWDQLARNRAAKSQFPFSVVYPFVRSTALWHVFLESTAAIQARGADQAPQTAGGPDGMADSQAISSLRERYSEELRAVRDLLQTVNIPLVYTIYPSYLSVYGHEESDRLAWLDDVTNQLGIRAVSYLPALARDGRPESELYLLPYDGHPSAHGYAVAAKVLADRLIAFGAVPSECS